jgi:dephospho-CoA kinase
MAHVHAVMNVAITGGIAMGKSAFMGALRPIFDQESFFDADQCVGELLTRQGICEKISGEFGSAVLDSGGKINRSFLRHQVFDSAERRAALESILHPEVYKCYLEFTQEALASPAKIIFADVPLLFETGKKYTRDLVVVVACDKQTQLDRLQSRSGMDPEMASRMVAAQLPIEAKMKLADHVIWNSGSLKQLDQQIKYFAQWLKQKI